MSSLEGVSGSVVRIARCDLHLSTQSWAFAQTHADAIEAHWRAQLKTNPGYFNGVIHVMTSGAVAGDTFNASFIATDFKSALYWRACGYPAADAFDAFGSALIRSAEGHVLLGRQSAGHINSGLAYLPGGFIDARDVAPDGTIDIAASIARELREETSLTASELTPLDGFTIVRVGPQVSLIREFRSSLPSDQLRSLIMSRLATDPDPELADIVIIRTAADLPSANVPAYTSHALTAVFDREL